MSAEQRSLLLLNVIGGVAVLASYWWGVHRLGDDAKLAWGNIPVSWRGVYTANMFAAAAGYFPFTALLLFGVDASVTRVAGRLPFSTFHWIYAAILIGSALWLPLTVRWIESGGDLLWTAIHLDLIAVGLASLALLIALVTLEPRPLGWAHALAIAGALPFFFQTAILDALIWPAHFPH